MVTRTDSWLRAYEARNYHPETIKQLTLSEDARLEGELHNEILDECRRRGWIAFHGSMAHRTKRTEGEPDFEILADRGRSFYIEAKTKIGKESPAQLGVRIWAEKLGHKIHLVRSIEQFIELVR